jgi:hypothetical protein
MKNLNEKELEQLIHATLRSLPDRKAPGTLEARVLAALEHRGTIAWYHRSWSYWPATVRTLFMGVVGGLSAGGALALYFMSRGLSAASLAQEVGHRFPVAAQLCAAGTWVVDFANRLVTNIPALWVYGGLALVAALYATFFGLGAAAYRVLYRNN